MQYHTIPHTDLNVSKICLGTMTWGQQNTEHEAHEQLSYTVDEAGVNFIDTAELYPVPPSPETQGRTEQYIGTWLAKRGTRDDIVLASKVVGPSDVISSREGPIHLDRQNIRQACEDSLERLQTDYLDLYQIHWPERRTNTFGRRGFIDIEDDRKASIEETMTALGELIDEGKVRYIGLSNETPWGVHEFLRLAREKSLPRPVTIQNQYSLLNRTYEIGLSEFAMREGIELLAYSPLSMGVLSGKYLDGNQPDGARFSGLMQGGNLNRYNSERAQEAIRAYVDIAEQHGLDPAQMALAFVNQRPFVGSNIIGATSMEQLKTDIDSINTELSEAVMNDIEAVYQKLPDPHA